MKTPMHERGTRRRGAAGLAAILVGASALVASAPAAIAVPMTDGLSSSTAAASCWEIKQLNPGAADGTYWLNTPALGAPEQFYCDMTTDGGGWVLIGRGREGWSQQYEGQGTSAQVREMVSGVGAFVPKQLASKTIDGLLDNGRVDALADGIRVRRATNTAGTAFQEARFKHAKRDRWVWAFGAEHPVGTYSFDGVGGSGGLTSNFGSNSADRRIDTTYPSTQSYLWGWSYGSSVTGTPAADSYLWSKASGVGAARPFAQVFVRPRLTSADLGWNVLPDEGLPARARTALLDVGILPGSWGVTGQAGGSGSEAYTEVQAFTQIGNTVFVGGNFRYVQRGSAGLDRTEQPFLAAFDVATGDWIPSFRPQLNGMVRDIAALPNGKLVAGGQFTQANGQPVTAIVALDPLTGATDTNWSLKIENRVAGGVATVRSFDVQGTQLYLGGSFTHLAGGTRSTSPVFARSAARVSTTNATPDSTWNPNLNGTVVDLDASAAGDRFYAAGYFTTSNAKISNKQAAIGTAAGAPLAIEWNPAHSSSDRSGYQQSVVAGATGTRVYVGGSEHRLFGYDTATLDRRSGNISKNGGDFQVAEEVDGVVYGGCHCNDWTYSNAYTWSGIGTAWTQADKLGFVGAWNTETGAIDPEFNPILKSRVGSGAWAVFEDSTGNVWLGGDFVSGYNTSGYGQWAGSFVRFKKRDTAVPTTPISLASAPVTETVTRLSWGDSTDASGGVQYQVLRNDRVVATTNATTLDVPAPNESTRYFVRAVDATGNLSATTPVLVAEPGQQPPLPMVQAVSLGSSWRWVMDGVDRGTAWKDVGYDDASWNTGATRIGYKIGGEATIIDWASLPTTATGGKPITAYYRRTFSFEPATAPYTTLTVDVVRDDGAAVYLNGVELVRNNLPDGPITVKTGASVAVTTIAGARTPVTFQVPTTALVQGSNTIAVEVHQNHAWGGDMAFDLGLRVTG